VQEEKNAMPLTFQAIPVPLRVDEHGVVLVEGSRVEIQIVIRAFLNGDRPEEIARGYSTLELADVYAVIAYYLRHREEVDAYIKAHDEEFERVRREIEAKQPDRSAFWAKVLARKAQMEQEGTWPGQ
jgi:uncharacterized protein (DUF433 family)